MISLCDIVVSLIVTMGINHTFRLRKSFLGITVERAAYQHGLYQMTEIKDRLKRDKASRLVKARRFFGGYESARSVCMEKGWNYNNYKAHEGGLNGFSEPQAREYAEAFSVSLAWLVSGEGLPQGNVDIVEVLQAAIETAIVVLKIVKPSDEDLCKLVANAHNQLSKALEQSKRR